MIEQLSKCKYQVANVIVLTQLYANSFYIIRAGENFQLLLLDGHTSYFNWEFFNLSLNKGIIPFCLPAHSTHLLQPLDVGLFASLPRQYSNGLDRWFGRKQWFFYKMGFLTVGLLVSAFTTNHFISINLIDQRY